ncbi:flagellar assembly protein FlbE [Brevundimonas variabilis]|uniref:Flagellar assembly protein FliH n=1 Tax=Brevundimonas variabilis TaxID=74312 RepID=A0A7W9CJ92_9CAUL|nr:flagellar assembly protein FlbE [Brevundimonas variabilis]MBB5746632.1 flagellar assembly protein FliH [Brevundimonas variabilis]
MTQPSPETYKAFHFDTEFDAGGSVLRPSTFQPMKRSYAPAEVEALVAQARLEAREAALAEVASVEAMAVAAIGQAIADAAPSLAHAAQMHREHSAELALAAGRIIALAALNHFPAGPLQAALEALGQEIDASPRLVIRAAGLDDAVRTRLQAVAIDAGFSGLIAFRDDPALPMAAFQLEWADGRADFDPAEAAVRMGEALTAALAAEAGHAENLSHGSSH